MRWPFEGLAGGVQEPPALQRAQDAERRAPTTVLMVLALDSWCPWRLERVWWELRKVNCALEEWWRGWVWVGMGGYLRTSGRLLVLDSRIMGSNLRPCSSQRNLGSSGDGIGIAYSLDLN